ncbi:MAG: hypothetical protein JWN14_2640 [Chthonomonadales bacterium]|nr:hypothetical protein [Chthonomonadales bacterium]
MAKREEGYVHSNTVSDNFYTSGPTKDPAAPGGRFISTGDASGKTSRTYDSEGNLVKEQSKGDGGPSKGAKA